MDKEQIVKGYVERAKINFQREIEIRTATRLREIAYILGVPLVRVKELWYGVSQEDLVEMHNLSL